MASFASKGCAPHILTLFASKLVDAMVGDFAAWKHSRWGLEAADTLTETRRAEDEAAARELGASVRWLGVPDAIYRGDRYTSNAALYGPLHPEEHALAEHFARELQQLPEWQPRTIVFMPLAVGHHVDHQIAFECGCVLARRGVKVWAYEDLPYAIHTPRSLDERRCQIASRLLYEEPFLIADSLARKLDAVSRYESQLPVIFRFNRDYCEALSAHAMNVGGGAPAERFWRIRG